MDNIKEILESLYKEYHKPEYITPDPLQIVKTFNSPEDREIVGLISASLATGRVNAIIDKLKEIFEILSNPYSDIIQQNRDYFEMRFRGFKYRFYDEIMLVDLIMGIKNILIDYGSIRTFFEQSYQKDFNLHQALIDFVKYLNKNNKCKKSIVADPTKGSACKRHYLYLKWMIRSDNIDCGDWKGIPESALLVPIDTHMYQISKILGFTKRKSADLKTAIEITDKFKEYEPNDPAKYDFALTRMGIHPSLAYDRLLELMNR